MPQHYPVYVDTVLKDTHRHLFIYLLMRCISIDFTQLWGIVHPILNIQRKKSSLKTTIHYEPTDSRFYL